MNKTVHMITLGTLPNIVIIIRRVQNFDTIPSLKHDCRNFSEQDNKTGREFQRMIVKMIQAKNFDRVVIMIQKKSF